MKQEKRYIRTDATSTSPTQGAAEPQQGDTSNNPTPAATATNDTTAVTLWQKVKPWLYMCIMFVVLMLCGKILVSHTLGSRTDRQVIECDTLVQQPDTAHIAPMEDSKAALPQ